MTSAAQAIPFPTVAPSRDENDIRRVRETLKGPVIQTLRRLVPDLSQVAPERAYDHTLANLGLLETCFKTFRSQRDRFQHILQDKSGRTVTSDNALLTCGHTLEHVIAMIVRTAAKRYFRHHIGLDKTTKYDSAQQSGLLGKMRNAMTAQGDKKKGLAEELYDSIKAYLLFEWQVPLVPTYARMSPKQVMAMGQQILQYTDEVLLAKAAGLPLPVKAARQNETGSTSSAPAQVRSVFPEIKPVAANSASSASGAAQMAAFRAQSSARPVSSTTISRPSPASAPRLVSDVSAPSAQPPKPITVAASSLRAFPSTPPSTPTRGDPSGKKLSGASFAPVLAAPQVQAAIDPNLLGPSSERIIDHVGAKAWAALILTLGLRRKDQLAVLILNAFGSLGVKEFLRLFGNDADPELLDQLLAKAEAGDISPNSTLPQVIAFVGKTFVPNKTAALR